MHEGSGRLGGGVKGGVGGGGVCDGVRVVGSWRRNTFLRRLEGWAATDGPSWASLPRPAVSQSIVMMERSVLGRGELRRKREVWRRGEKGRRARKEGWARRDLPSLWPDVVAATTEPPTEASPR